MRGYLPFRARPKRPESSRHTDMTFRTLLFFLVVASASGCAPSPSRPRPDETPELSRTLADGAKAFYADHGRWPRDVDELTDVDASRFRTVHFHKRLIEGGLEIRYQPSSARGADPETHLYVPPPRSWSPKGVRTRPATSPATTQAA